MKIAIDCRYVLDPTNGQFGGISEYTDGLVRALLKQKTNDEFVLFFSDKYPEDKIGDFFSSATIARVPMKRGNFFFNHFSFPQLVRSYRPDVFFAPHGQLPLGWRGRAAIAVHDLAIFDHPEWFPGGFSCWFSTKIVVPRSFRRAEKIIAVSEATKKDLFRLFNIPKEKIFVVYPAATVPAVATRAIEDVQQKFNLPEKYFLCLGTIEPRKNFSLAVRATKILSDQGTDVHLAIAGKRGWKWQETINEIEKVNQNKKIISELGYVSVDEKYALLTGAQALIFPSLYEGFGLPVLEALKMGVSVITTAVGSLPEVGGEAVKYVSLNDPDELARVMSVVEKGLNKEKFENFRRYKIDDRQFYAENNIVKVFSQAAKFSWQKSAEEIFNILREK